MQPDVPRFPPSLRVRAAFWVLCWQARRRPFLAALIVAGVVALAVLAARAPVQGCSFKVVAVPGEKAHMVCAEGGRS
jgi:hypothetical protein